jgi:chemotaxis protein MotB
VSIGAGTNDKKKSVIVIEKLEKAHTAHHGGSGKVACADLVTAMMAFFMVMWILGMDSHVRKAIEGYFTNPVGREQAYSSGGEYDLEWQLADRG